MTIIRALLAIIVFSVSARIGIPEQTQATIRAEVALVNVVFSAFDRHNREVPGLTEADFLVYEDHVPQRIQHFSSSSKGDEPRAIALLIDTSASIRDKLDNEKKTAADFFRGVIRREKDTAMLLQFNTEVELVRDFTRDPEQLIEAMQGLRAGGGTALYDAIFVAAGEKLKVAKGRRVIVVITDGEDTASRMHEDAVIKIAQKNDVLIYGIGFRSEGFQANFDVLKKLSKETGGRFFTLRANEAEMQSAFQKIYGELQNQYSLAYTSTNTKHDGAYRAIEVHCRRSGIHVRTRNGYYAPVAERSSEPESLAVIDKN